MSDLRERVAVAIMTSGAGSTYGDTLRKMADAAIALCMEEAARVVECSPDSHTAREMQLMLDKAAAIRALATASHTIEKEI